MRRRGATIHGGVSGSAGEADAGRGEGSMSPLWASGRWQFTWAYLHARAKHASCRPKRVYCTIIGGCSGDKLLLFHVAKLALRAIIGILGLYSLLGEALTPLQ